MFLFQRCCALGFLLLGRPGWADQPDDGAGPTGQAPGARASIHRIASIPPGPRDSGASLIG